MALLAVYNTQEEIPEQYVDLFTERDGKWELTEVTGMKTQADVDRLNTSLVKERADHKATKEKLAPFSELDPEQMAKDADELAEARIRLEQGEGGIDEEKMEALVTARVATQTAPLKRDLDKLTEERDGLVTENGEFKTKETNRLISDSVREAAIGIKVIDTAMDDVLMLGERVFEIQEDGTVLTKDGVGVTPGIAPDIWLSEMQDKRPHWWPAAQGGGANGGGGGGGFADNPFSAEHWNMTKQGAAQREDPAKAERMAKSAGTTIGGPRPVAAKSQ
ncbi:hypothetical protein KAR91_64145 [Candidatus Pacearchaeota archaeon]|nr:hypothetical protein [Candidatus Pacearchaeota archaeon]